MTEAQYTQLIELGQTFTNKLEWIALGLFAIAFVLIRDNFKSYSIIKTECPHCRANKDQKSEGQSQ